jgi:hypothetical protein
MANRFDTPIQFNPYIREIPTELATQVGLSLHQNYMGGVQQVQNQIDQIAGMDVVKDADKQLLRQKLSGMGSEISKLAMENFGNPLVVGRISQITAGVNNDPSIQNAVLGTKAYRQKKEMVDTLRQKNPELYNSNNEAYSMIDIQNWLQDGKAGSRLVDNHPYNNYYDYAKEVREAMKDFKPSRIKSSIPNGQWIVTNEDQSWTDNQLKGYLQGVLSDRAKQQMKIEAVVAFQGNDSVLHDSYISDLKKNLSSNDKRIKEIGVKSIVENNDKARQLLNDELVMLKNQNEDISGYLQKFKQGDNTYFLANKENIASQLFRKAYVDQVAKGYSHPDISLEYSPNAIWQTIHIQNMENARMSTRMQFDANQKQADRDQRQDLKMLELGLKYLDKDGKVKPLKGTEYIKSQPNLSDEKKTTTGEQEFIKKNESLDKENQDNYNLIKQKLLASSTELNQKYLDFIRKGGHEGDTLNPAHIAAEDYLKKQLLKPASQRDKWASEHIEEQNRIITQRAVYDQMKQQIDNKLSAEFGKEYQDLQNQYKSLKSIRIPLWDIRKYNGYNPKSGDVSVNLTPSQLSDLYFIGANIPVSEGKDYIRPMAGYANTGKYEYRINGIEGTTSGKQVWEKSNPDLVKFLSLLEKNKSLQSSATRYKDQLYSQAVLNLGDYWTPVSDKDPAVKQSINYIQRQGGGDPSEYNVAFVNRTTGEVQFRLSPKKNSQVNPTVLKSLGYKYDTANDTYLTTNLADLYRRDVSDLTSTEKVLITALDGNVNIPSVGFYTPSSKWDPAGNGQFFQIVKDMAKDGSFHYYLRHENSGTILDYTDLADPVSAVHAAKKLAADKKLLQDVIRKKNPDYSVEK